MIETPAQVYEKVRDGWDLYLKNDLHRKRGYLKRENHFELVGSDVADQLKTRGDVGEEFSKVELIDSE